MLEKILYLDHSITSLTYKELSFEPSTGGSLSYDISDDVKIEVAEQNNDEPLEQLRFLCEVDIRLKATNKNIDQDAFTLEATLQLIYQAPEDLRKELTPEFFAENLWFLKNTIHLISHQALSNLLAETKFRNIAGILPKSRIS